MGITTSFFNWMNRAMVVHPSCGMDDDQVLHWMGGHHAKEKGRKMSRPPPIAPEPPLPPLARGRRRRQHRDGGVQILLNGICAFNIRLPWVVFREPNDIRWHGIPKCYGAAFWTFVIVIGETQREILSLVEL